jgi:hypothetical protein
MLMGRELAEQTVADTDAEAMLFPPLRSSSAVILAVFKIVVVVPAGTQPS